MQILLIRHARAQERRAKRPDAERALTSEGRERLLECRAGLAALEYAPTRILHSPWLRAAQTAALLAAQDANGDASVDVPVDVHAGLARAPDAALAAELAARGEGSLWCVGHEPWLSELACVLVGLPAKSAGAIALKKCGVLVLERDGDDSNDAWKIAAQLPPRVLRRLGANAQPA
ncbi:MAG: phosphohistidine phosphatase [Planctomycetota bacterium]|nr:MAG: phosphohistidine phosphatase [Planctomycetota bacterium]